MGCEWKQGCSCAKTDGFNLGRHRSYAVTVENLPRMWSIGCATVLHFLVSFPLFLSLCLWRLIRRFNRLAREYLCKLVRTRRKRGKRLYCRSYSAGISFHWAGAGDGWRPVVPALFQLSFDHRDEIKRVGSGLGSCRELKRTSVDRRWDGEKTERWEERDEGRCDETPLSLFLSPSAINGQKEKRWFSGITFRPRSLLTRLSPCLSAYYTPTNRVPS